MVNQTKKSMSECGMNSVIELASSRMNECCWNEPELMMSECE